MKIMRFSIVQNCKFNVQKEQSFGKVIEINKKPGKQKESGWKWMFVM